MHITPNLSIAHYMHHTWGNPLFHTQYTLHALACSYLWQLVGLVQPSRLGPWVILWTQPTNHSKTHSQHSHVKQGWMMLPKLPLVFLSNLPHNTIPLYCCNLFLWPVSLTFIDLPLLFCITFLPLPSPTVYFHTLEPCSLRAFFIPFLVLLYCPTEIITVGCESDSL